MQISWKQLNQMVSLPVDVNVVAEKLTLLGLEVDAVERISVQFSQVVVAQITSIEKHPQADKLRVCAVDTGKSVLQIVCGASNARAGLKVACIVEGGVLPGLTIKRTTLRGVESQGMLCSRKELNLGSDDNGIMELALDAPIGMPLEEYLQLDDWVIDIALTPNRGDCYSVLGVSRELAAIYNCPQFEFTEEYAPNHQDQHHGSSLAPEACARFSTCVVHNVNSQAKTPDWMVESLRRANVRSVHPVVDVTNFVMLELGQPLHAYDASKINGSLKARWADSNEKLSLLDGRTITMDENTLVIADDNEAVGLAGIMGGGSSSVDADTSEILLEAAWFNPIRLAGVARRFSMHTEASLRFERGVDPYIQTVALQRAASLIQSICGAQTGPINTWEDNSYLPELMTVELKKSKMASCIGADVVSPALEKWFAEIGFELTTNEDSWTIKPPTWRFDIAIAEDVVEEVARFNGYDQLPQLKRADSGRMIQPIPEILERPATVLQRLVDVGMQEIITYSFVDNQQQKHLFPDTQAIALSNPISADKSVMRLSLVTGMLEVVKRNQNHQHERIAIFERGLTFVPTGDAIDFDSIEQKKCLGLAWYGKHHCENWQSINKNADFFVLKGVVEMLLRYGMGKAGEKTVEWRSDELPSWMHPHQSAVLCVDGEKLGFVAVLHPVIAKKLDIHLSGALAQLDWSLLSQQPLPNYQPVSMQPRVRRDLSLVIPKSLPVAQLLTHIKTLGLDALVENGVFAEYDGQGIESGMRSVSFYFIWQAFDFTHTDSLIEDKMQTIVTSLQASFEIKLR